MAEILFERGGVALEATPGTPITAPTYYLPARMVLSPRQTVYRPEESRGTRAQFYRSKVVKQWSEWSLDAAGADVYTLPVLLNMAVASVTSPTTPTGATTARLWTFTRSQTSVTERTGTLFWGDPNVQSFRAAYGVVDGFSITGDASGDEAVTMAFNGRARALEKIATPTWPAQLVGPLVTPLESQLWLDTTRPIGTTAINGRVISAAFSVDGLRGDPKFVFAGPSASKTPARFGIGRTAATLRLRFELLDTAQYDLLMNESVVKARVRFNGPQIEPGFYHYIEIDIYGMLDEPEWGEFAGTNRSFDVTITSQYDATAGHDWSIKVQNDRTGL